MKEKMESIISILNNEGSCTAVRCHDCFFNTNDNDREDCFAQDNVDEIRSDLGSDLTYNNWRLNYLKEWIKDEKNQVMLFKKLI